MSTGRFMAWLTLLGVLLTGCATSASTRQDEQEALDPLPSWAEARMDPSCLVPLCDDKRCAVWRCSDLGEVDAPELVLVRATPTVRPPGVGLPHRWWGHPLAVPRQADPVFEIPWHNWKTRGQLNHKELRPLCINPPNEPFEKHHIFPQQQRLARWFQSRNIDIHAFTIRIPRSFHSWLHSGGPEGGQWNEAWRRFIAKNRSATQNDVWRFAFELMNRFGVHGQLVPYHCG